MKLLFLYISTILISATSGDFYDIKFETIEGSIIKTSAYQGKKIVVAVVSGNTAGVALVRYLDSVQKETANLQVIAIPTDDFDGSISTQDLKELKKNISIVVTRPLKVKKANASLQHPLFQWLTLVQQNQHFDHDVEAEGQVFVVSAKGTLYSVLPKDTPAKVLLMVINEPFKE
ncbi:hypothetical protein [Terrimonas pollutisoli]|uniref:hypothetical protein n=1 Tax=Terrimonas pollutisoli TaxID=3034147 RepID=UPI0023EC5F23|nr:hypothetical protein [Terrimonas sp. H1YJ31]